MRANTWTEKLALMTFQLGTKSFSDCNWLFATVTKKLGIILTPRAHSIIDFVFIQPKVSPRNISLKKLFTSSINFEDSLS